MPAPGGGRARRGWRRLWRRILAWCLQFRRHRRESDGDGCAWRDRRVARYAWCLPVYTGTRLRGAQLDIARARGFAGADRAELISTLTAVLQRQPDVLAWARAELEQLRHRAAGALAYEVAGRIQAEIEALDWVTSPQRVTTMDASDFQVCGWSGGVLVRFGIRDGRLRQWSQRKCSRSGATPQLAATPAGWRGFAQRNAELAAALVERSA